VIRPPAHTIDVAYLRQVAVDLVGIDSVNPSLVPGAAGEVRIAAFVAKALARSGLEVSVVGSQPDRPSVLGTLRGQGGGRSLMLNAHLDTVGVQGMEHPFAGDIQEGRLRGRGAYDMKGSLAACLAAAKALAEGGPRLRGDLVVAAVADEEYASLGTADVVAARRVDAAIVTEPTELDLCVAHKGFVWLEVETTGRAAHGSRFAEGVDANMRMGRFLARLDTLERALRARAPHPLVGPPSLHAPVIRGGSELSTYAASCRLGIERRTVPGETEAQVVAEVAALADDVGIGDPAHPSAVRRLLTRNAFEVALDAPVVQAVARAAARVRGRTPALVGRPFWMDSALLADAGVDTVIIGPVGGGAHTAGEWVDMQSLAELAAILAAAAADYCA
jgi:acetylornithine deacetylase